MSAIAAGTAKIRPEYPYAPTLGAISENQNRAMSHFDGLEVKLDKRFSNGMQALVTYTRMFSRPSDLNGESVQILHNERSVWSTAFPIHRLTQREHSQNIFLLTYLAGTHRPTAFRYYRW